MPEGQFPPGLIEDLLAWLRENGINVIDNEKKLAKPDAP